MEFIAVNGGSGGGITPTRCTNAVETPVESSAAPTMRFNAYAGPSGPPRPYTPFGSSSPPPPDPTEGVTPVTSACTPPPQHAGQPKYASELRLGSYVPKLLGNGSDELMKRTNSPPLNLINSPQNQNDAENSQREMIAKSKRLARFNVDKGQSSPDALDGSRAKFLGNQKTQVLVRKMDSLHHTDEAQALFDTEGSVSSDAVAGLCPDMCPESEREERERKGDLDRYERLDGDKNQTTKFLAVKKYNRTAERDAELIRPMPVLLITINYLMDLLDEPYGEHFLGIYNFLWDRMRAVRMDLRMQHLFNVKAIIMLEQMIRLHIAAMHELCEYQKGEGFSEGFDAHLNIEQMNKTSVELFQMYEDHRKRGKNVPTEKEFRGYYALLKLDKHPGYKVEPAELSHGLAKMTSDIRCTSEVQFARDVARACRTGNFISFFRLARKATYLQACLMHAHFSKLRTHALASLHSGLQNNQGIPVERVVNWLAMEEEDIRSHLEYHGFTIKEYEDKYMVKDGPFLNSETEFPTKLSQLVNLKKSRTIREDVKFCKVLPYVIEAKKNVSDILDVTCQSNNISLGEPYRNAIVEEMLDDKCGGPLLSIKSPQIFEVPSTVLSKCRVDSHQLSPAGVSSSPDNIANDSTWIGGQDEDVELCERCSADEAGLPKENTSIAPDWTTVKSASVNSMKVETWMAVAKSAQYVDPRNMAHQKDEASKGKLKLILRKWKQRTSRLRSNRENKRALYATLSSLTLGPSLQQNKIQPRYSPGKLDIDVFARERNKKQKKFRERLDISGLVAPILCARNPNAKCICWKLLVCANNSEISKWLLAKLLGDVSGDDREPFIPFPGIAIWKKWMDIEDSHLQCCCLSVVRKFDTSQQGAEDAVIGLSCLIFPVSQSFSLEVQRVQLHSLMKHIPPGSCLPLLVISSDFYAEENADPSSIIINGLGLPSLEMDRRCTSRIVFVGSLEGKEDPLGVFFNDDKLVEGIKWMGNNSPLQPAVRLVKTRELVLSKLRNSLNELDNLGIRDIDPEHCISSFNEALDKSSEQILAPLSANPNNWPCPEIEFLEDSSARMAASFFLPCTGWSSATQIEAVTRAIEDCRLPSFSYDISWLKHGCYSTEQIPIQKVSLQECLMRYMTQLSQFHYGDVAATESNIMLQMGAGLELRDTCYYIVPRWMSIFHRIFNRQLMKLTVGKCSTAYVLEQKGELPGDFFCKSNLASPAKFRNLENCYYSGKEYYDVPEVSLDEMVEASSGTPLFPPPGLHEGSQVPSSMDTLLRCQTYDQNQNHDTNVISKEVHQKEQRTSSAFEVINEEQVGPMGKLDDDRFSSLLKRCTRLQDHIDGLLFFYQ